MNTDATPLAESLDCCNSDRRCLPRHPCSLAASLKTLGKAEVSPWPARTQDISLAGIGLIAARRFERATPLALMLHGPFPDQAVTLLARVVRVMDCGQGSWLLGCAFPQFMDQEDFLMLLHATAQRLQPDDSTCVKLKSLKERLQALCNAMSGCP